ncbi:helix-turn-helix domain-containing protein [Tenacibaculum sp. MAR_2009_124]|uniref:helix-turn-helix domain-containing protein n=1 Tax=Tenacibaculum sp. MAR_2009_124 TaxID=1250059 RepID=UPI0015A394DE|nr:helix-turn-helix domain-containing protein [Tenacibaculum sp. MAR_2009_124]
MVKRKRIPSNITDFDNLKWIRIFFRLGLLSYVSWFIPLLITLILKFNIFLPSYYPLRIFTTILIYWLGYQSIIQLRVLQERKYLRPLVASNSNTLNTHPPVNNSKSNKQLGIPDEIIRNILLGLDQFEQNKGYTSQNMNLTILAKELNTNTSYLSKIVNYHKETSFTNYLNTLRITNIITLLESNSIIRKYTIKAIAQEAGFSNSDSFSKAFVKLKNITPSEFIKNLK